MCLPIEIHTKARPNSPKLSERWPDQETATSAEVLSTSLAIRQLARPRSRSAFGTDGREVGRR